MVFIAPSYANAYASAIQSRPIHPSGVSAAGGALIHQAALHRSPESRRIDRGIAVELRLDLLEPAPELLAVDQAPVEHLEHVLAVLGMPALDLRECLGVEVVVIEGEAALAGDEGAALLPTRERGDELVRRRQLDVDLELLLDPGESAENAVGFRVHLDIDVDRAGSPSQENRRGSAREVETQVALRLAPELPHEAADAFRVYRPTHSAVFSKLTRRRTRALYREWAESGSVSASLS